MPRRSDSVTVRVPASTSNLGSGFDTLGLALQLHNRITLKRLGPRVSVRSLGDASNSAAALEMVESVARVFWAATGRAPFAFQAQVRGNVPVARGVGFSATVRLGVLAALNVLARTRLDSHQLLSLATELEGHPDNVSPALLGGFTVSGRVAESVRCLRFKVDARLKVVALFPSLQLRTDLARSVLPSHYSKADAAHSLNRASLITAAFASGEYEALRNVFDDRLHQPYRETLLPLMPRVIRAGEKAGALGGFLSGAGSGVICLTLRDAKGVAAAMRSEWPEAETKILCPDNRGLRIE